MLWPQCSTSNTIKASAQTEAEPHNNAKPVFRHQLVLLFRSTDYTQRWQRLARTRATTLNPAQVIMTQIQQ
eukprot:5687376-Karenia_brevis.AAC.1